MRVLLIALFAVSGAARAITLDEVLAKNLAARGGAANVQKLKTLRLTGRVVWVEGRFAGIRFEQPLNRDQVLRHVPKPRQKIEASFRRPGLACRPLSAHERKMLEVWMTAAPVAKPGEG